MSRRLLSRIPRRFFGSASSSSSSAASAGVGSYVPSATREIIIGTSLGIVLAFAWKNWQWNDKAVRLEWYRKYNKELRAKEEAKMKEFLAAQEAEAAAGGEGEAAESS